MHTDRDTHNMDRPICTQTLKQIHREDTDKHRRTNILDVQTDIDDRCTQTGTQRRHKVLSQVT